MDGSDKREKVFKAFISLRENLKQPKKDAQNPFFNSKYVNLPSVIAAIDDGSFGKEYKLTFLQEPTTSIEEVNGKKVPVSVSVTTYIIHESEQYLKSEPLAMPVGGKQDAQAVGSAITYARRYSLEAIFGISDNDDDGNATVTNPSNGNSAQAHAAMVDAQQVGALKTNMTKLATFMNKDFQFVESEYLKAFGVSKVSQLTKESANKLIQMVEKTVKDKEPKQSKETTDDPFKDVS